MKRIHEGVLELPLRQYRVCAVSGGLVAVLALCSILHPQFEGLQARSDPTKPNAWGQADFKRLYPGSIR